MGTYFHISPRLRVRFWSIRSRTGSYHPNWRPQSRGRSRIEISISVLEEWVSQQNFKGATRKAHLCQTHRIELRELPRRNVLYWPCPPTKSPKLTLIWSGSLVRIYQMEYERVDHYFLYVRHTRLSEGSLSWYAKPYFSVHSRKASPDKMQGYEYSSINSQWSSWSLPGYPCLKSSTNSFIIDNPAKLGLFSSTWGRMNALLAAALRRST